VKSIFAIVGYSFILFTLGLWLDGALTMDRLESLGLGTAYILGFLSLAYFAERSFKRIKS
jgi:hypothetical protein